MATGHCGIRTEGRPENREGERVGPERSVPGSSPRDLGDGGLDTRDSSSRSLSL